MARTAAQPSCHDLHQDLPAQTAWLESVGGDSKRATAVTVCDLLDRRGAEHDEPAELDKVARAAAARFEVRAEKPGMQALERRFPDGPTAPGRLRRREFEYKRHGTQTLLCAFNVHTGNVIADCGDIDVAPHERGGNELGAAAHGARAG